MKRICQSGRNDVSLWKRRKQFLWKKDKKNEVLGRSFPIGSKMLEHNNEIIRKTVLKVTEHWRKKVHFDQDIVIESLY